MEKIQKHTLNHSLKCEEKKKNTVKIEDSYVQNSLNKNYSMNHSM